MYWRPIDTETGLSVPGDLRPPLVCLQCGGKSPMADSEIYNHWEAKRPWVEILEGAVSGRWGIIGHNLAYDFCVLRHRFPDTTDLLFQALDTSNIWDTMLAEQLIMIAEGVKPVRPSLAQISAHYLDIDLDKGEDTWRKRYIELLDVPVSQWPSDALAYAAGDVDNFDSLVKAQFERGNAIHEELFVNLPDRVRGAFALQEWAANGLPVDHEAVDALEESIHTRLEYLKRELVPQGLVDEKGTSKQKPQKALVVQVLGDKADRTEKGNVRLNRTQMVMSGNPLLKKCSEYSFLKSKALGTSMKWLRSCPRDKRLTANNTNPILDTGRVQAGGHLTVPQDGGYRECIRAPEGRAIISCDYDTAEMRSFAQTCLWYFGRSDMAEVFRDPRRDVHTEYAAKIGQLTLEEAYRLRAAGDPALPRDMAKVGHFGLLGGMGAGTFAKNDLDEWVDALFFKGKADRPPMTIEMAETLKSALTAAWWEVGPYFQTMGRALNRYGLTRVQTIGSQRIRGVKSYTQMCNTPFQSKIADVAVEAAYELVRATLTKYHDLEGSQVINFIHDEALLETDADPVKATRAAKATQLIMMEVGQGNIPDVPITCAPALANAWTKRPKSPEIDGIIQIYDVPKKTKKSN